VDFSTLTDEIAAVAHRCWCKRMLEEGWRRSTSVDCQGKGHDAIRAYEELTDFDKVVIREQVECDELERQLANAAGEVLVHRELAAADLHIGMPVRVPGGARNQVGHVVGWEPCEVAGRLAAIKVQWPDGAVLDYGPVDRLIVPARPNA
jgi:hypothetical protein